MKRIGNGILAIGLFTAAFLAAGCGAPKPSKSKVSDRDAERLVDDMVALRKNTTDGQAASPSYDPKTAIAERLGQCR